MLERTRGHGYYMYGGRETASIVEAASRKGRSERRACHSSEERGHDMALSRCSFRLEPSIRSYTKFHDEWNLGSPLLGSRKQSIDLIVVPVFTTRSSYSSPEGPLSRSGSFPIPRCRRAKKEARWRADDEFDVSLSLPSSIADDSTGARTDGDDIQGEGSGLRLAGCYFWWPHRRAIPCADLAWLVIPG